MSNTDVSEVEGLRTILEDELTQLDNSGHVRQEESGSNAAENQGISSEVNDENHDESHAGCSENSPVLRQRRNGADNEMRNSLGVSEFECGCCFELMVEPTTLDCGHSLCRHCLARWFLQSKKRQCPQCKQIWTGHPHVNLILRNTIETVFGAELEERRTELYADGTAKEYIKQFDIKLSDIVNTGGEERHRGFCSGLTISLVGALILYLIWYWGHSEYDLLVHKPIQHWRVSDVDHWLRELGSWAEPYAQQASHSQIDGILLLNIDEDNIDTVLNISTPLHVKAVLSSLNLAKSLGVKPPQNLWDFKALYRGQTLFLLYGMKDFPRVTILFSYFFAYDEVFVPFVQCTIPVEDVSLDDYNFGKFPPPTASQLREFTFRLLFFPYFLIISFTWHWLDDHYWTSRLIIVNCTAMTILECISVWRFVKGNWGSLYSRITTYIKSWLSMGLFAAVWPIIPIFFTDLIFYIALFYSPFLSIERLYKEIV